MYKDKHVLITGGSTGIGLALAKEFVTRRANVTIVSRTKSKLEEAVEDLKSVSTRFGSCSTVDSQSADVTVPKQVKDAVEAAEGALGPIHVLVCNAGAAYPGYFHEQDFEVFESSLRLNYLGVVATVQAVYPRLVQRNCGQICLVSSVMGTMGFAGYSAYSASKYAVRGFADCLRNELQGTRVRLSLAFPPDTNTPGFQRENESKPVETHEISNMSTVFSPEQVAAKLVQGLEKGMYILPTPDLGLTIHTDATKGFVPRGLLNTICAMLIGWAIPLVHSIYGALFDRVAKKHAKARFASLWPDGEPGAASKHD